jgi:hypothetical protein
VAKASDDEIVARTYHEIARRLMFTGRGTDGIDDCGPGFVGHSERLEHDLTESIRLVFPRRGVM